MEQSAIGDRIERLTEAREVEGRGLFEMYRGPSALRLLAGATDRRRGKIDPPGVVVTRNVEEGVLSRPAADVKDPPTDLALLLELDELALGAADFPGGRAVVGAVE